MLRTRILIDKRSVCCRLNLHTSWQAVKREQLGRAADLQQLHCLRRHLAAWRGHQQQVGADGEARLKAALLFSNLRSSGAAACRHILCLSAVTDV